MSDAIGQIHVSSRADRMVIDATGLMGYYDFKMRMTSDKDVDAMAQIEEDLGLKFEPRKVMMKTYVIDSAEKPSIDGAEVTDLAAPKLLTIAQVHQGAPSASETAYVPTLTFDVASVRESKIDQNVEHIVGGGFKPHTSNLTLENVQMYYILEQAYGVTAHELQGIPDWGRTSFNIQAKSDTPSMSS
jgi:Protein of unknown function (DUF3738)